MDMNVTYEVHQMMKLFCAQEKNTLSLCPS